MDYELILRSAKYPADIRNVTEETIPGKPLADDIAAALRDLGYRDATVVNAAPLWLVEVGARKDKREIVVHTEELHDVPYKALWNATVHSRRGLWATLIGQAEDAETLKLARALDKAVRMIDGLELVRREGDWGRW
ncbi:MAG TPA: hypothetical protein VJ724_05500 [Tahibacter sp.]|nr:hypothetical protein [Tahibacter sp.]